MGIRARNNTKWLTNVFPRLSEIRNWCMDGKTNEEMCVLLGISPDSWFTYMRQYNQLNDIVTAGKSVIDNRVENAVLKTALKIELPFVILIGCWAMTKIKKATLLQMKNRQNWSEEYIGNTLMAKGMNLSPKGFKQMA